MSSLVSSVAAAAIAGGAIAVPSSNSSAGGNPPAHSNAGGKKAPSVEAHVKPIIKIGQRQFRDLNANGKLDPYEDWLYRQKSVLLISSLA